MLSVTDIYALYGLHPYANKVVLVPPKHHRNPQKYAEKLGLRDLVALIKHARDLYYNSGLGAGMPDKVYDALEDELRKRRPQHKLLKQVGAPVKKAKVKLPYNLPSLDKLKDQRQIDKWSARFKDGFVVSDKIDGVSLLVISVKGKYQLFTRGNGTVGQDISYLVNSIKLPKTTKTFAVRGELVMAEATFKSKYRKAAENPRNLMSGLVNRKGTSKELKDADFIAYEIIKPGKLSPEAQFKKLKAYGFKVAPSKKTKHLSEGTLFDYFQKRRKASKYELDGLVITSNHAYQRVSSGNPDYMVAFKSLAANEAKTATVVQVEWNLSKNGYLKPRVQIKPTRLSGTTVKWATGFNFKFIKENKVGKGAQIEIIRSGDVIPRIMKVVKPARKPDLPSVKYKLTPSGVDAIAVDKKAGSKAIKIKQAVFFLRTMGIEGWKVGVVSKLFDNGYDDILDIIHLEVEDLVEIPGFQQRGATKLVNNLDGVLWTREGVDLAQLMTATGHFGVGVGSTRLEQLVAAFPNILTMKPAQLEKQMTDLSGFSNTTIKKVVEGLEPFKQWLKASKLKIKKATRTKKPKSSTLAGQVIVFTGFRSAELEQTIKANGGTVGSGVSGKTTIVVYRGAKISGKLAKAQERGIKTMTEDQFKRWLARKAK